jgi:hypothetical protein
MSFFTRPKKFSAVGRHHFADIERRFERPGDSEGHPGTAGLFIERAEGVEALRDRLMPGPARIQRLTLLLDRLRRR